MRPTLPVQLTLCSVFFYRLLIPLSFIQYIRVLIIGLVPSFFLLFSKTRSGSRREPIARSHPGHGRLSKKFIVGKLQCFDNFLPCHAAVSAAPRHKHHDCGRKEHALTQILCRLKQRFGLWSHCITLIGSQGEVLLLRRLKPHTSCYFSFCLYT